MQATYAAGGICCCFKISPQLSENGVLPHLLQYVPGNGNPADKSVKINYTFLQVIHIIPEYIITKQSGSESVCILC